MRMVEWFIYLLVFRYASKKKVKIVSRDPIIYCSAYQNTSIKRRYTFVEGLDKFLKPVDKFSVFKSTQICRESQRKQLYNKKRLKFKVRRLRGEQKFLNEMTFEAEKSTIERNMVDANVCIFMNLK